MSKYVMVFDIETIPDTDACFPLTGHCSSDVNSARQKMEEYHLDITEGKNPFLRQPFHKVIAVSILVAEICAFEDVDVIKIKEIKSGTVNNFSEKELLESFFGYFAKIRPRLVSFNGRTFDLPVMRYRAMKYEISCSTLYSGDRWNNYNNRYSTDWHCDLLEVLSDYGQSARIKMVEVCSILGLPGKLGVDGSKVTEMYDSGKMSDISNYCETDVINTYLIYLKLLNHQGKLIGEGYSKSEEFLVNYLREHEETRSHFRVFLENWDRC